VSETAERATFTRLDGVTAEQFAPLHAATRTFRAALPDRVLRSLARMGGEYDGFPVDRLTHSLQTATLALRDDRDDEYVFCALVHDIGDDLAFYNHGELAAVVVHPFVGEANHWMVRHHPVFQGFYYWQHVGRDPASVERLRGHRHFDHTWEFVERYDQRAFDPAAETLPLAHFEPLVRRVMAQTHPTYRPEAHI
jgi:predicted HD phosphohydrolase